METANRTACVLLHHINTKSIAPVVYSLNTNRISATCYKVQKRLRYMGYTLHCSGLYFLQPVRDGTSCRHLLTPPGWPIK